VVLEVVRRLPDEPPGEVIPGRPYRNRCGVAEDGADPGEPALHGGPGQHRPFG
jgi:hypothetical protein